MNIKYWLYAFSIFASISLACSVNIPIQRASLRTGPTQTETIEIDLPENGTADLRLNFGAGKLKLAPGTSPLLVAGTATYNIASLKPSVEQLDNQITLSQESLTLDGIPVFDDYTNEWDLELGTYSLRLEINAGAYEGDVDLGGLALEELRVMDGAASNKIAFNKPNPTLMQSLHYETGASQVSLLKLGNANVAQLTFRGGVGDYLLDFSGDLQRDAVVTINTGLSDLTIIVPEGANARVSISGGLASTSTSGSWQQSGGSYSLDGTGPTLTFDIEIGAGALDLRTSP
jgi:hypothetical protein